MTSAPRNQPTYREAIRFSRVGLRSVGPRSVAVSRVALSCLIWFIHGCGQSGWGQACINLTSELAVNQSFGRAGAGMSLTGRTTYAYTTDPCPLDGLYTVGDAVEGGCFVSLWHGVTEDHTPGDVRGNMMIVNGSEAAGEFYAHPLAGLCSGTAYEFSVWAINLLKPGICTASLVPDLSISIETADGRVIQSVNIGIIPESATPAWRRYAIVFTAPETTDGVVVKLINRRGSGGCGNDLALDDIQLKQCGTCPPTPVYVPEAFSPNNDGVNDELAIFLRGADSFTLTIFNRWGNSVFNSDALNRRWNGDHAGTPCPVGEYTWMIRYRLADATGVVRQYTKTGRVRLLR